MLRNFVALLCFSLAGLVGIPDVYAQVKQRTIHELTSTTDPAWPIVLSWINSAKNKVEILPKDSLRADSALLQAQVTTRSTLGAVIYQTGGILVDGGWIRIIGSGNSRFTRSLMNWNKGKSYETDGQQPSFLLVGDDAMGGFFAINAGGLDATGIGKVFYRPPDGLTWEPMDWNYSEFLSFCFDGDLKKFYRGLRWKRWNEDLKKISADQVFYFSPFLFTKEGRDVEQVIKDLVPIEEWWGFYVSLLKSISGK